MSALGDKLGEARWTWNWFVIDHPSKSIETGDYDRVIVDYDRAPFVNRILVAAPP